MYLFTSIPYDGVTLAEVLEHLDGGREAGGEDVRGQIGILGQNLIGGAGGEQDDLFERIDPGGGGG